MDWDWVEYEDLDRVIREGIVYWEKKMARIEEERKKRNIEIEVRRSERLGRKKRNKKRRQIKVSR